MNNEKRVHIIAILDKSGSMSGLTRQVRESFNEFIEQQREDHENEKPIVTVVTFNNYVNEIYTEVDINDMPRLTSNDYNATGMTALYDALGHTIKKFDKEENVILLVQTDGHDNRSKEYSQTDVKYLIEDKQFAGWDVNFLGANINAENESAAIGIPKEKAFQFAPTNSGVRKAYASINASTMAYKKEISLKG